MDPNSPGPEIHYYMIRGGADKRNITVWEAGKVGIEYIKAYGHYHVDNFVEAYKILEGSGILLLQIRKKNAAGQYLDEDIESFQALKVKVGDSIAIPPFAGHLLVNTGKTWLVTSDDSPVNLSGDSASMPAHADYESVRKMGGFAYFVIEQGGQPALVKNPKYKSAPEAKIVSL